MRVHPVDVKRLRERRLALSLGHQALTGVVAATSTEAIRRREEGSDQGQISLATLTTLAEALGDR